MVVESASKKTGVFQNPSLKAQTLPTIIPDIERGSVRNLSAFIQEPTEVMDVNFVLFFGLETDFVNFLSRLRRFF